MNQTELHSVYKQQQGELLKQLKQCYLFDRYPIKKQLDQSYKLIKQLPQKSSAQAFEKQGGKNKGRSESRIAQQLNDLFAHCQERIEQSIKKVEQRRCSVPTPEFTEQLPVSRKVTQIQSLLEKHQVIVVAGETGSGKTTQLPKIALLAGRGLFGQIAHTQPRRLAARSVASRIAEELKTPLGESVGFKVRFSDRSNERTYVKLMTDGILLAETQTDRLLNRYDTIIIDEAHERSLNIDFLLGYLKQLLPRRPDLKVIITSATIDTERFSSFFDNAPVIEVSGRT
jgi:ATP-dependent helicase HrpA